MGTNYFLYLLAIIIIIVAQSRVQSAYHRYKNIDNEKGLTGAQVARAILDHNQLQNVQVEVSQRGTLSDHYDPTHNIVRLSPDIYYKQSIAAISIAAHEVGHAIQHKEHYGFIGLRNRLLPFANIASNLGWITLFLGLFIFGTNSIVFYAGVIMLLVIVVFQLVTLPVELNASSRAIKQLTAEGFIYEEERSACRSMLNAAAFTYIAALLSSIIQVLRVILIARRNND